MAKKNKQRKGNESNKGGKAKAAKDAKDHALLDEAMKQREEEMRQQEEEQSTKSKKHEPVCKHIKEATKSKKMPIDFKKIACQKCPEGTSDDYEHLLFCHRCSTILCDQTVANHAAEHASDSKQPQQHTIMYRAAKNHFICVECDKVIDVPMYLKKLRPWCDKIHANLREVRKNNQARGGKAMFKGKKDVVSKEVVYTKSSKSSGRNLACGLQNLGNTCFFNSSMQALSVTRALGSITEEDTPQCVRDNSSSLTCAFVEVLKGMRTSQGGVYNPKALHTAVRNRWRQFKGFRQEDAHELIRCMLDGLQEDERKALKRAALQAANHEEASTNQTGKKNKGKAEKTPEVSTETHADYISRVFGGQIVSIVACDTCKTCSYRHEDFLDLSLPIADHMEEKEEDDWGNPFTLFSRKSKKAKAKQDKKKKYHSDNDDDEVTSAPIPLADEEKTSDAAEIQELEEKISNIDLNSQPVPLPDEEEKENAASEQEMTKNETDDVSKDQTDMENQDARTSTSSLAAQSVSSEHADTLAATSEETLIASEEEEEDTEKNDISALEALIPKPSLKKIQVVNRIFNGSDSNKAAGSKITLVDCLSKFTLTEKLDGNNRFACEACWKFMHPNASAEPVQEGQDDDDSDASVVASSESASEAEDPPDVACSSETPQPDEHNKPTKTSGKSKPAKSTESTKKKSEPRYVMRDARKRILIEKLPPVLVIQLKRFRQTARGFLQKVSQHVQIPETLDMKPFVVPEGVRNSEENAAPAEPIPVSTKYRLYAIVEHSGSLYSGHYVAYIYTDRYQLNKEEESDASTPKKDKPRIWLYCSDSRVRESSWEEVANSQAYIAFYERIEDASE